MMTLTQTPVRSSEMSIKLRKHRRLVWAFVGFYIAALVVDLARNLLDPGAEFALGRWVIIAMGIFVVGGWMIFEGLEFRRTPPDNG
jgi:hypothetical protein